MSVASRIDSWHLPIEISIPTHFGETTHNRPSVKTPETYVSKTVWDSSLLPQFLNTMNSEKSKEMLMEAQSTIEIDVNQSYSILLNVLRGASSCMTKQVAIHRDNVPSKKCSLWYDRQCKSTKNAVKARLRKFQFDRKDASRRAYVEERKKYKKATNS